MIQNAFARMEARGKARGCARAILTVLETRGVEAPHEVAERVRSCTDLEFLRGWLVRAVTVAKAEDIFD